MTQNKTELITRWTEWIKQQFQNTPEQEKPKPMHIPETIWGQIEQSRATMPDIQITEIPNGLNIIRNNAHLTKICNTEPTVLAWLAKDYTDKEVKRAITNLRNNKAHGCGGIPGEAYRALR